MGLGRAKVTRSFDEVRPNENYSGPHDLDSKRKNEPADEDSYYDRLSDIIDQHPIGLPGAGRFGGKR